MTTVFYLDFFFIILWNEIKPIQNKPRRELTSIIQILFIHSVSLKGVRSKNETIDEDDSHIWHQESTDSNSLLFTADIFRLSLINTSYKITGAFQPGLGADLLPLSCKQLRWCRWLFWDYFRPSEVRIQTWLRVLCSHVYDSLHVYVCVDLICQDKVTLTFLMWAADKMSPPLPTSCLKIDMQERKWSGGGGQSDSHSDINVHTGSEFIQCQFRDVKTSCKVEHVKQIWYKPCRCVYRHWWT